MVIKANKHKEAIIEKLRALGRRPTFKECEDLAKGKADPSTVFRWGRKLYPDAAEAPPAQGADVGHDSPPGDIGGDSGPAVDSTTFNVRLEEVAPEEMPTFDLKPPTPSPAAGEPTHDSKPASPATGAAAPVVLLDTGPIVRAITAMVNDRVATLPVMQRSDGTEVRIPAITNAQCDTLKAAYDPLAAKYLPKAAEYAIEINAISATVEVFGPFVMATREYRQLLAEQRERPPPATREPAKAPEAPPPPPEASGPMPGFYVPQEDESARAMQRIGSQVERKLSGM